MQDIATQTKINEIPDQFFNIIQQNSEIFSDQEELLQHQNDKQRDYQALKDISVIEQFTKPAQTRRVNIQLSRLNIGKGQDSTEEAVQRVAKKILKNQLIVVGGGGLVNPKKPKISAGNQILADGPIKGIQGLAPDLLISKYQICFNGNQTQSTMQGGQSGLNGVLKIKSQAVTPSKKLYHSKSQDNFEIKPSVPFLQVTNNMKPQINMKKNPSQPVFNHIIPSTERLIITSHHKSHSQVPLIGNYLKGDQQQKKIIFQKEDRTIKRRPLQKSVTGLQLMSIAMAQKLKLGIFDPSRPKRVLTVLPNQDMQVQTISHQH